MSSFLSGSKAAAAAAVCAPLAAETELRSPQSRALLASESAAADDQRLLHQLHEMSKQNEFLRDYAARLEAELRVYQVKFPDAIEARQGVESLAVDELAPWVANADYMSPLIAAYDGRIQQLQHANQGLKDELVALKAETKKLIERNESLENELEHNISRLLRKFEPKNGASAGILHDSDELSELQQRCELLGDENQILRSQECQVRQDLDEARVELHDKDAAIERLTQQLEELNATADAAEDRVKELSAELEAVQQEMEMARRQVESAARQREEIEEDLIRAQNEAMASRRDANQYQEMLEEHEISSKRQVAELSGQLSSQHQQSQALSRRIVDLESSLEDMQHREKSLVSQVNSQRHDMQGMLATIESLERSLAENAEKASLAAKQVEKAKDDADKAALDREQALSKLMRSAQDMSHLEDKYREQLSDIRRAGEQALTRACDSANQKETELYEEIRKLELVCANLESAKEKADRDVRSAKFTYERLCETAAVEQARLYDELNALKAEVAQNVACVDRLRAQHAETSNQRDELRQRMQQEQAQSDQKLEQLSRELAARRMEASKAQEHAAALQIALDELKQGRKQELRKHQVEVVQLQEQSVALQRSKDIALADLEQRLQEAFSALEKAENRAVLVAREQDQLAQTWREQNRCAALQHSSSVREMKEEISRLLVRNQELEAKAASLVRDRDEAMHFQESQENASEHLKATAVISERRAQEVSAQLANAIGREQGLRRKIKDLQHALDRAEMENKRIHRQADAARRRLTLQSSELFLVGDDGANFSFKKGFVSAADEGDALKTELL